jgi:hypothetical protein
MLRIIRLRRHMEAEENVIPQNLAESEAASSGFRHDETEISARMSVAVRRFSAPLFAHRHLQIDE